MTVAITLEVNDDLKIRRMLAVDLDAPAKKLLLFDTISRHDAFRSLGFGLSGLVNASEKLLVKLYDVLGAIKKERMAVDHCDLFFAVPLIDKELDTDITHKWHAGIQFLGLVAEQQPFVLGLFFTDARYIQIVLLVGQSFLAHVLYLVGNQLR